MNTKAIAWELLKHFGTKALAERHPEGDTEAHLVWMLKGLISGYVEHEKAHRWLGYVQGFMVCRGLLSLNEAKDMNRRES